MPDDALKPGLRAALRQHEIGSNSPYKLLFAAKGKSGASFGFMQGDLAAGQQGVQQTFQEVLAAAGFDAPTIAALLKRLSVHLIDNPLSAEETARVNAALLAGQDKVDAMDELILAQVYDGLDKCISTARAAGCRIAPEAQIYMALWINMTGPPTKLLSWLQGADPGLGRPVPAPGQVVSETNIRAYLGATNYFMENPRNFMHMVESASAGIAMLRGMPSSVAPPPAAMPAATLAAAVDAHGDVGQDCVIYEQATGRMFLVQDGARDLIGTGYSGSEAHGGKNNPHAQCEKDIGPIPRGIYTIGAPFTGPSPFSLRLTPDSNNDMCGRDGFLIHGDSIAHPGTASHGCIILNRTERNLIAESGVTLLRVMERLG
jgi:hypothetical protein